ncbi:MAG TPA: 3-deoxy-manno-octulosonate cytidylyltransferase [Saprospiraceae bacterium]|mgnify:CR=1 FL=1|nr:3-deoxy-manno-octulosonate cytidylyltransferase [Saprospiraceae bacterium]HRO07728.1 3-deoxy-manno-octulosonate cytidylyltransferase [Saprospiraceae bacterium]HRP41046.1 3-deoxy-manno-octulosonate cytidylyltransferase [Saprospiraceae bacterium]
MKISIIIPSRLASTRLPQKPLADIGGKSLIQRVYLQASKVKVAEVIVATDDMVIYNHVQDFGGTVFMTSPDHQSGTDRVAEVAGQLDSDIIINLQGDEPLIDPIQIGELIRLMERTEVQIGTQCTKITDLDQLFDYNVVKVVRDDQEKALYFSRQAIPAIRDSRYSDWVNKADYYRHIGMYGFKRETLLQLQHLTQTSYEKAENLEQLRWLQHGFSIYCSTTNYTSVGVDTPEDLERVRALVLKETSH